MRRIGICLTALLLMLAFAACQKGSGPADQPLQVAENGGPGEDDSKKPVISFDSREFDFGTIEQGEKVEHVFKFKNTGDAVLHVEKVRSS